MSIPVDTTTETEYLTCAETAKFVRQALKDAFPTVTFSVRSDTYSMGASIRVSWVDGPRKSRVEAVVHQFAGADFDGMVDLKTTRQHFIAPNGKPVLAYASGSGAYIQREEHAAPDVANVRRVPFGADFIFCSRRESNEQALVAKAREMILTTCKTEGQGSSTRFGENWVDDLARGMVRTLDFEAGTTLDQTFREVVLRERE